MDTTKSSQSLHGQWSSRLAFIIAATGSAVGLGNLWKFPYIAGENGGGAFVLVYLLCVLAVGLPLMMAETLLGRRGQKNPVATMADLSEEAGGNPNWRYLGGFGIAAGFIILSYYSVIAGWACAYTLKAFDGSFFDAGASTIKNQFDSFIANPGQLIFWHTGFLVATLFIVMRGIHAGFEKILVWIVPGLFGLMVLLLGYAMTTEGYFQGLHFLFNPDFNALTGRSVLLALGQAFFSLGLAMGSILVYGAYLPKNVPITSTLITVAAADTLVALLAGLVIFPLVFSYGLNPGSGPGLIFETLPIAFGNMPGGWLFGTLFFAMLVFAALSSSIALIEPTVVWLIEAKGMSRRQACICSGVAVWFLGLFSVFSFNLWSSFRLFGLTVFELIDYVTADLLLPVGGFALAIFAGWVMRPEHSQQELAFANTRNYQVWYWAIRYFVPAALLLIFLDILGVW